MADTTPRINLLYYKNILDNIVERFVRDNCDYFTKTGCDYVLSKGMSRRRIFSSMESYFVEELEKLTTPYNILRPEYYFIIGSCTPKNNILLDYECEGNPLSNKLKHVIEEHSDIKYFMKEHDIKLDINMMNCIFEELFSKYFMRKNVLKTFGKEHSNLFLIKHRRLDCYTMYRILKDMFGRTNVINIHKQKNNMMKETLESINEIIGKKIQKKKEICRSKDLEITRNEIRQYVENCIFGK